MVQENSSDTDVFMQTPHNNLGGPRGLGDPNDRSLRKVEKEVMIPKIMRDRAKKEKCAKEVADFEECCKTSSVLMVMKCREENDKLKNCLTNWYKDSNFINECTEIYLKERSAFRTTGLQKKYRDYLINREQNKAGGTSEPL